jgi:hypothetical protein
MKKRLKEMEE